MNFRNFWKMLTSPLRSNSDIFEIENILMVAEPSWHTSGMAYSYQKRLSFIQIGQNESRYKLCSGKRVLLLGILLPLVGNSGDVCSWSPCKLYNISILQYARPKYYLFYLFYVMLVLSTDSNSGIAPRPPQLSTVQTCLLTVLPPTT